MIAAAQRDDSHQSNCNCLKSGFSVVARDLVENELFALQVERQLRQQNTRVLVESLNSNTEQNLDMLSEETILSDGSKTSVCYKRTVSSQ